MDSCMDSCMGIHVDTYGADEAAEGGNALALHDGVTTLMYEGGQSIRSALLGMSA